VICARSVTAIFGQVDRMGGPISWITHITNPDHIKIHDKYNPWDFQNNPFVNDIAMIFLEQATDPILLPFVNTIEIATDPTNDFYGKPAAAMGFGSTQDPPGALSLTLNYVEMPVTSNQVCNDSFPGVIVDSNLCTSTTHGGSTCQGDAGGPLIIFDAETTEFVLIGVGSFRHRDGCTLGHPGELKGNLKF
jgi:secreted trypsin-like serine protease